MLYPALEKELKNRALLYDEIKMWLRLGFYVSGESQQVLNSSKTEYISVVTMIDGAGNKVNLGETMGKNIRLAVLRWWQVERDKPRASEPIDSTGIAALENRNGS